MNDYLKFNLGCKLRNPSHFRHLCMASKMECFRNHLSKGETPSGIPSVASDH